MNNKIDRWLLYFDLNCVNGGNFDPLEVVGRGSSLEQHNQTKLTKKISIFIMAS